MLATATVKKERERLAKLKKEFREGRDPVAGNLRGAPSLRVSLAVNAEWLAIIDDCAERRGVSRSAIVREATLIGLDGWWQEDLALARAERELAEQEPVLDAADASLAALPDHDPPELPVD